MPLKLCIILSGPFSYVSYYCVVYVYNDRPRMKQSPQSHHSRTGLTSHIFYAYNAFSSFYFSFYYVLSLTMMTNLTNMMNQMVADQGVSSLSVRALHTSMLNYVLIKIIFIRVGISLIFSRYSIFFIFCSFIRVVLSRVSISLIFSRSLCSRSNIL